MKTNPIFKRATGDSWTTNIRTGRTRFARVWHYRCSVCGEERTVRGPRYPFTGTVTRKIARDALHAHMMERHRRAGPGGL